MLSRREFLKLPVLLPFVDVNSTQPKPVEGLAFPVMFAESIGSKPAGTTDVDIIHFRRDGLFARLWRVLLLFIK